MGNWAFLAATVREPTEANGPTLDTRVGRNRRLALEYERRHSIMGRHGAVRVLAFQNKEHAGTYREALHLSAVAPTLYPTRRNGVEKYGFGLNVEQALSPGVCFIIGDGRLNYRPEQIVECYYAVPLKAGWTITGDFQRILNPAYNRDRGPVSVEALRWER